MPGPALDPRVASTQPVVLIVEDNANMRSLIRSLVEQVTPFVHECADGDAALDAFARVHPDCVLMDIRLGATDGITATAAIRELDPGARVIIVTDHDDAWYRRAAHAAGASGYVHKEALLDLPQLLTGRADTSAESDA